jgi:hypothetical protein
MRLQVLGVEKDLGASFEVAVESEKKTDPATNPDEMLMVKYDKSFEKAVDWTAAAVKKIAFNSAAADT